MSIRCFGKLVHYTFYGKLYTEDIFRDGSFANLDGNYGNSVPSELLWFAVPLWYTVGTVWQNRQKNFQKTLYNACIYRQAFAIFEISCTAFNRRNGVALWGTLDGTI